MFFGANVFAHTEQASMQFWLDIYNDVGRLMQGVVRASWELWLEQHEVVEFIPPQTPARLAGPHEVLPFTGTFVCTG